MNKAAIKEPAPVGSGREIYPLLLDDIAARVQMGLKKHGRLLHTDNGRDPGNDWLQEMIDALMYCKQLQLEWDELRANHAALCTAYDELLEAYNKLSQEQPETAQFRGLEFLLQKV